MGTPESNNSVLNSIKSLLGISTEDVNFDPELIVYINGALSVMTQLGIGPEQGFVITGANEMWTAILEDREDIEVVKTATYLRVRLLFDPPQNSFLVKAIQDQIQELDWRIEVLHSNE